MFIILKDLKTTSKSWKGWLFGIEMKISIDTNIISLSSYTETLNIVFACNDTASIKIAVGEEIQEHQIVCSPGSSTIKLENKSLYGTLSLIITENVWNTLDSTILGANTYNGCIYYSNTKTCESAFSKEFMSKNNLFPSFSCKYHKGKYYYADALNKIVICTDPSTKQNHVKEALVSLISTINQNLLGSVRIKVDRENLLQSGALAILKNASKLGSSRINVSFRNEIGEDYGAVRRELFYLLCREIIADSRLKETEGILDVNVEAKCEFIYDSDFKFEILEDVLYETESLGDNRLFFMFLGVFIGLTIKYQDTLPCNFSLAFYENLLDRKYTIRHLQDVELQRSLIKCLDKKEEDYADASEILNRNLFNDKKPQYDYIRVGFKMIIPIDLSGLTAFDLPFIFYHFEPISEEMLKRYCIYEKCSDESPEIRWLWEILKQKDQNYLCLFLQFFTGSGVLPVYDESLRFWFELTSDRDQPFKASTCSKRLFISRYNSKERMEYFLDYSVLNTEGFHKV